MPHAYTEDQLVEQPAIGLFVELGWAVIGPPPNASVPGVSGQLRDAGLLSRESKDEVVLVSRLPRPKLGIERLNPALPPEAIPAAVDEMAHDLSAISRVSEASFASSLGLAHFANPHPNKATPSARVDGKGA